MASSSQKMWRCFDFVDDKYCWDLKKNVPYMYQISQGIQQGSKKNMKKALKLPRIQYTLPVTYLPTFPFLAEFWFLLVISQSGFILMVSLFVSLFWIYRKTFVDFFFISFVYCNMVIVNFFCTNVYHLSVVMLIEDIIIIAMFNGGAVWKFFRVKWD